MPPTTPVLFSRRYQVVLDPRVWRKEEGAPPRVREPSQCVRRDVVEALLQVRCRILNQDFSRGRGDHTLRDQLHNPVH